MKDIQVQILTLILWHCVGYYCQYDVDECVTQPGICKNGATCLNSPQGSYTCICVNGWTGKNCTTNIDDCAADPCFNGGTCHDKVGYYHCECPTGKTGMCLNLLNYLFLTYKKKRCGMIANETTHHKRPK